MRAVKTLQEKLTKGVAGFQQGGEGVNTAPQNWGGGLAKRAQLIGPSISDQ